MSSTEKNEAPSPWRALIVGFVIGAVLLAAVLAVWQFIERRNRPTREASSAAVTPATPEAATLPPAPAPVAEPTPPPAIAPPPAPRRLAPRPKAAPATPVVPAPAPAPAPEVGSLFVDSDVPGASVFIDRVFVGPAPATAKDLTAGSHQLNVSADGYAGISQTVEIAPGENNISVRFKELTLNVAIDVIHSHTFGSCQGRLSADGQGVRYVTTNKQDSFAIPFADLSSFELDYLNKMLRVGKRGGRAYTFTDNKPNADTLFAFHRDVQRVRMKLMQK